MTLFLHVVMVAIHCFLLRDKRFTHATRQRGQHAGHHDLPVLSGKILRPFHRFNVVVVVPTPFLEIRQVSVRQIRDMLLHILLRQRDKDVADGIPHTTRTTVQHHPDALLLIQTHFNEVITGSQRSEMLIVIGFQQRGILVSQARKARCQCPPVSTHLLWRRVPRPFIATGSRIGSPVGNGLLNRAPQPAEVIRQIASQQRGTYRNHPTADVHPHCCRNNRSFGRDHAANR